MRPFSRSVFISALSLSCSVLAACGTDHVIRGPDGEAAHVISCTNPESCYRRASRDCPRGYVIRSMVGTLPGATRSTTNLVVTCKSDLPDAPDEPEDERQCAIAFRQAADFATYYQHVVAHGPRLSALPTEHDFVSVCRKLPENVQPCLHDRYREEHASACDAVVTRLEPRDRNRLDGLFFEAESTK
jgi:hypothetical protein